MDLQHKPASQYAGNLVPFARRTAALTGMIRMRYTHPNGLGARAASCRLWFRLFLVLEYSTHLPMAGTAGRRRTRFLLLLGSSTIRLFLRPPPSCCRCWTQSLPLPRSSTIPLLPLRRSCRFWGVETGPWRECQGEETGLADVAAFQLQWDRSLGGADCPSLAGIASLLQLPLDHWSTAHVDARIHCCNLEFGRQCVVIAARDGRGEAELTR